MTVKEIKDILRKTPMQIREQKLEFEYNEAAAALYDLVDQISAVAEEYMRHSNDDNTFLTYQTKVILDHNIFLEMLRESGIELI